MSAPSYVFQDAPGTAPRPERPAGDWKDFVAVLLERVWIAATVFVIAVVAGVVYTQRQTPMYRSVARIFVEAEMPKVLNIEDFFSANARDLEQFNTHLKALYSRAMMDAVIKAKGLDKDPRFMPEARPSTDRAVESLRFVSIDLVPRTRLIDIVVEHRNPELAAVMANGLAEQYIQQNLERRMQASMEAFEWLRRQAETHQKRLEQGRMALHEYRKENLTVSLEEDQDIVIAKLKSLNVELTQAEAARISAEAEWSKVQAALVAKEPLGQVSVVAADDFVRQSRGELLRKQSEVAVLQTRYRGKHPEMAQALTEVKELENAFETVCRDAAKRIESKYRLAKEKEDALRRALQTQEQRAFELERKLVKYTELKRNVEADQHVYEAILSKMKETQIAGDIKTNNIRLVDAARPSAKPFRPSPRRNLFQSLLIGLVAGVAMSFAVHFADDRIRRIEDVEHELGVPVLGIVSSIAAVAPPERALVTERERDSPHAEAFRALRASLALRPIGRAQKIMVTSTEPREGKSLVASNLAVVLAHDGQKTLLVDGDMRRPFLHKVFGEDGDRGLSSALRGGMPWRSAVRESGIEHLSVMTAGPIPPNPSELLGSAAMRRLLDETAGDYARVVVDCPPIFGVSDPLALLPAMEGIIFVVHFNRTGRRAALRALAKLREGSTPVIGVVLNNVNLRSPRYSYYRYGYPRDYRADGEPARKA